MGSGWKGDQDTHQDMFVPGQGWADKKAAPKQVRDQDQDVVKDKKGQYHRRNNAILGGFMDQDEIEDHPEHYMHHAGDRMMAEEAILHQVRAVSLFALLLHISRLVPVSLVPTVEPSSLFDPCVTQSTPGNV